MVQTSVIIPCAAQHLAHLPNLMSCLRAQTARPDEVVVSVSECGALPKPLVDLLASQPFPVVTRTTPVAAYAAKNRNTAVDASSGNVLIYQDADDLPHRQRIEAILAAFRSRPIDHLMHQFAHETWNHHADLRALVSRVFSYNEMLRALSHAASYSNGGGLANGLIATSRDVFQRIRWPEWLRRGEDVDYNQTVYQTFARNHVLELPLVIYRQRLTTDPSSI